MSNVEDWLNEFRELNPETVEEVAPAKGAAKKYALDLFTQVLPAIDRGDKKYYSKLTPEEQKSIEPWMLMRWVSAAKYDCDMPYSILATNTLVNENFSSLSPAKRANYEGHRELQWMLMTMCGRRGMERQFMKPPRRQAMDKIEQTIIDVYPSLRKDEINLLMSINSVDEVIDFLKDSGLQDKEIEELLEKRKTK